MKAPNKSARPAGKQSAPEKTDTPTVAAALPAVNLEQAEVIALLQRIAATLDDIYSMEVEQLHMLRRINSGLP